MSQDHRVSWFWVSAVIVLLVSLIVGSFVAWSKLHDGSTIEISLAHPQEIGGTVFIDGGVSIPGAYPFNQTDTIGALVDAAGGLKDESSLDSLRLVIPEPGAPDDSQRVDINRADIWLLQALPGIGETLAQRIVDYRNKNGPFHNTSELMRVSGIGQSLLDRIKDLITVAG